MTTYDREGLIEKRLVRLGLVEHTEDGLRLTESGEEHRVTINRIKRHEQHPPQPRGRPQSQRQDAIEWLHDYLAKTGTVQSGQVQDAAAEAGIRPRTLRRAAEALEVIKSARGGSHVTWTLPD